jgi:hypothetical protein
MLSDDDMNRSYRDGIWLFMAGLAMSLVAKGVALFPFGRSIDSYPKLVAMSSNVSTVDGDIALFIAQGRVGQWVLNKALAAFGIRGPGGNTLYVFLALCCFVAAGVMLCRLWRIEGSRVLQVCVVGIFAIHPYHAAIFTFREATLCVGLAMLFGMLSLVVAGRRLSRWIAGWTLMMISLSLYQVAFNYAVIALIVLILLEWSRSGEPLLPAQLHTAAGHWFLRDVLPRASAIIAALISYLILYKLSLKAVASAASSYQAQRGAVIAFPQISMRLQEVKQVLWHIFVVPEPLMPKATKMLIGVLAMLTVAMLTRKALSKSGVSRCIEFAAAGILLGGALLAIIGVMLPLVEWWPIDRILSAVSVLAAGMVAIVVVNGGRWTQRFVLAVAIVLLFAFAGVNNVLLSEQLRLNSRDQETAGRMIMRLEADPKFPAVKKLAVIGRRSGYALRFYSANLGSDVNVSAFARPWSKVNVIQEVSGYQFLEPSQEDLVRAEDHCRGVQPWPDQKAVAVLDDVAVICLSDGK